MNRLSNNISVDLLARLLLDVTLDSSKILDDLFTGYQCGLLDVILGGCREAGQICGACVGCYPP